MCAADKGFAPALFSVAIAYELGRGVEADDLIERGQFQLVGDEDSSKRRQILDGVAGLAASGSTAGASGIQLAYAQAEAAFIEAATTLMGPTRAEAGCEAYTFSADLAQPRMDVDEVEVVRAWSARCTAMSSEIPDDRFKATMKQRVIAGVQSRA